MMNHAKSYFHKLHDLSHFQWQFKISHCYMLNQTWIKFTCNFILGGLEKLVVEAPEGIKILMMDAIANLHIQKHLHKHYKCYKTRKLKPLVTL